MRICWISGAIASCCLVMGWVTAGRTQSFTPDPTEFSFGTRIAATSTAIRERRVPDPDWIEIHRRGALRVGIDPGLGYDYLFPQAESRSYDGFEWQILQALARHIGVNVQPIPIPWSQQLDALAHDRVDLIWGARQATPLDTTQFLMTQSYYNNPQAILVRGDRQKEIGEFSDLFGLRVGVVSKSTGAALMDAYNENRGRAIRLFSSRNLNRLVEQLSQQELDAVIVERPMATAIARQSRDSENGFKTALAVVGPPVMPLPLVGVVGAQRPAVKEVLDLAIEALEREGKLNEILEQWQL
ncbi:MAG: ABC transporter substrate-binding protein [Cyanobacteria bacterium J06642_2]